MADRQTLAGPASLAQEIRKSRFLALADAIDSSNAALAFISAISDAAATHNCWAYRVGDQYRFSDDGEPGGTAGRPILQAIDGQGLDGVAVVVTRWYGGIKLGAGGLMRAYGGCAAECLRLAPRIVLLDRIGIEVRCEFAVLAILVAHLPDHVASIDEQRYEADGAVLRIRLPEAQHAGLERYLADLTRGRGSSRVIG